MRQSDFYEAMAELARKGTPFVLATITGTSGSSPRQVGTKMLVLQDGTVVETIGGGILEKQVIADALSCLERGASRTEHYELRQSGEHALGALCGGEATVFLEVHAPQRTLLVIGAGHVGAKLATMGKLLDFRVVVLDARAEMLTAERLPAADDLVCGDPARATELIAIGADTHIVIVTHDHENDREALRAVLDSPAAYIGLMGSATKVRALYDQLAEEGVDRTLLDRVHSPIGLDIGAQTPAELALCIMAEIVAVGNGRPPGRGGKRSPIRGEADVSGGGGG